MNGRQNQASSITPLAADRTGRLGHVVLVFPLQFSSVFKPESGACDHGFLLCRGGHDRLPRGDRRVNVLPYVTGQAHADDDERMIIAVQTRIRVMTD